MDSEAVADAVGQLVQGTVLSLPVIPLLSTGRDPLHPAACKVAETRSARDGLDPIVVPVEVSSGAVMLLTQTCDLQARATGNGRVVAHVAPVIEADDATLSDAVGGTLARFVPVPWLGEKSVADLDQAAPIDRALLAAAQVIARPDESHRRFLAHSIGRVFARPALPDGVVSAMAPLRRIAIEARQPNVRRLLDDAIHQFRVMPDEPYQAATQCSLTVLVMVEQDWLPDAEPIKIGQLAKDLDAVATPLVQAFDSADDSRSGEIVWLWNEFAGRIEQRIRTACAKHPEWMVDDISVRVDTSLTPAEYEVSDALDLTYLSLQDDAEPFQEGPSTD